MNSLFGSEFFIGNRKRLRELFMGTAPIVLAGNGLLQRNGDTTYPFRQSSNFWYLTGLDDPDLVLVLDKDKEYLIVPTREETRSTFDGVVEYDSLRDRSGVLDIVDEKEGWKRLGAKLKRAQHVAIPAPPPAYVEKHGIYTNPAPGRILQRIKQENAAIELLDIRLHLTRMRQVKQPTEILAIQAAIDLTIKGFRSVQKQTQAGRYEFELEALLTKIYRQKNANHAYAPIVASGSNACTLHYIDNNQQLNRRDLVIIDSGAEVEHYAADITRTFSVGAATKRQESVLAAVAEVQSFAIGLLKPGLLMKELEQQVEHFMGEKLRELVLIKNIDSESVRRFYPHAVSHFLGLDVHDAGDYHRPLEAGMVLTVEPGIYIKEEGLGVRIEDDVLITEKGCKVLSSRLK